MRFRFSFGVLIACAVAVAAPIPKKDDKPKSDSEAILGAWVLDKFEGQDQPPPGVVVKFNFTKDGKMGIELGDRMREKGGYKIDPNTKPKSIDIADPQGETTLGIYELDGDTLKMCIVRGKNMVRPTEFKVTGKKMMLFHLKRVKDEKKDK